MNILLKKKKYFCTRWWWYTPLNSVFRMQRQENLCVLEANLIYRVSIRTVRTTQRNVELKKKTKEEEKYLRINIWCK